MKHNRFGGLFLLFALFLFSALFSALSIVSAIDAGDVTGGIQDKAEGFKEYGNEERWEFLSEKWKEYLKGTKVFGGIDSFFFKLNSVEIFGINVFYLLFAMDYDLSFIFFFILMFWLFVFRASFKLSKEFLNKDSEEVDTLLKTAPWIIAFFLTMAIAHFGFYVFFSELIFRLIFFKGGAWGWVWTIIFFIIYLVFMGFMGKLVKIISKWIKRAKEEGNKKSLRRIIKTDHAFIEGMKEGMDS